MSETIFVSGATGYIALYVVVYLLEKGYRVVGSVRSAEKGEKLRQRLDKNPNFRYEVIPDISVEGAFDASMRKHPEVTVFIHTASPFHYNTKEIEKDLLIPAIQGTKEALKAVNKFAPQVRKVVFTSSYVAINSFKGDNNAAVTVDENSWNDITWEEGLSSAFDGYYASKTFAERAAWEFLEQNSPHFSLSTVNPSLVFGPQAFAEVAKGSVNTSAEMVNGLLDLTPSSSVPTVKAPCVDVRDVARAHLVAFENEQAKGKRLLLSNERFSSQGLLDLIREKFPHLAGGLPVGKPGTQADNIKDTCVIDTSKTQNILGYELISLEETVMDSIKQVLEVRA